MIHFARFLAASAMGIGMAVGLILSLSLTWLLRSPDPATMAHTAIPVALLGTDPCSQQQFDDPDLQSVFELHCSVHSTLFNDGQSPTVVYSFEDPIEQPGVYDGFNYRDQNVEFDVVYAVEADIQNEVPSLFAAGGSVHMVAGTLAGTAGEVAVAGAVLYGLTNESDYMLLVTSTLSSAELAIFTNAAAITKGAVVIDDSTSYPVATATTVPATLSVYGGDFSTLHGVGSGVDPSCVQAAYDTYNNSVDTANAILAVCLASAIALHLACMGLCSAAVLLGPIGWGLTAACVLACLAELAVASAACTATAMIMIDAAHDQLAIDLAACGIIVVED